MAALAVPLAVVGWFIAPYINDFIKKAYGVLTEDIKEKLRKLQTVNLPELKAIIEAGDLREDQIQPFSQLMREFKDAMYEVEDFVDKIEYKSLAKTVSNIVSNPSSLKNFIPDFSKSSGVKELNDKISELMSFHDRVSNNGNPTNQRLGRPATTSELMEKHFGRETEREGIVNFLITNDEPKFKIVAIIGVGGVGKTILAQDLYEDRLIKRYFDLKMWVHVSENWDVLKMTKTMIQLAPEVPGFAFVDSDNLQVLQTTLKRRVAQKRFLLILDDVWYNDQLNVNRENPVVHHINRWSNLCGPLSNCRKGSKILITTRMKTAVPDGTQQFFLKGLELEQCRALFDRHAFFARGHDQGAYNSRLATIASEIITETIKKLEGLPSAAREAGLMLKDELRRENSNIEQYRCKIKLNILQNDSRNSLMWSYRMLRQELKPCFAHLSLYPRGFKFNCVFLTLSWIGAGVITRQNGNQPTREEMGREYFNDLVNRSFFQKTNDEFFVLHSPLHSLAEFITKEECMRIESFEEIQKIPLTIKHLSIHANILGNYKDSISSLEKLRTLLITNNNAIETIAPIIDGNVLSAILKKTKRLRALSLSCCSINELPDSIGRSKRLRFLDLSNTYVNQLPKSVCSVFLLEYLDLKNCELNPIPKDINKLINLEYLVSDGRTISMIPHIGKLTLLRELKEFHVKKEEGHDLGQLKNMDQLQGTLHILNLDAVSSAEEAEEAQLQEKSGLQEFVQEWSRDRADVPDRKNKNWLRFLSKTSAPPTDQEVLDKLQPPGNITKLTIRGYAGDKTPVWMHDNNSRNSNLQTLMLDNCSNLQGNDAVLLPKSLVDLKITDCSISDNHLSGCLTGLNKLTSLELHQCADVTTLPQEEVLKHLTSLKSVSIHDCDNLVSLGDLQILAPPPFEASRPLRRLSIQNRNGRLPQPLPDNLRSLM